MDFEVTFIHDILNIIPQIMVLISVCIPTFNNSHGIKTTVEKLILEAKNSNLLDNLEFCISDNSDNTDSEEIVTAIKAIPGARIYYLRHGQNLGYDRNVDAAVRLASGKYCWLLSDNEDIRAGSFGEIIASIKNQPDTGLFIICPQSITSNNLKTYSNLEKAIKENGWWIPGGLVSRNIIKRSLIPSDLSVYYGNDWLHLSITTLVGGKSPVTFVSEKFIHDPNEKSRWAKNGKTFVTYTNLLSIIKHLPSPPYSKEFVSMMTKRMLRGLPQNILSAKIYGLRATFENWKRLYTATRGQKLYLFLSSLTMMVPPIFVIYGKKIKHTLGN